LAFKRGDVGTGQPDPRGAARRRYDRQ
jgi:hypothetical protein